MTNPDIEKTIIEKLHDINTQNIVINSDTAIVADLGVDSLAVMEFIMELEEVYNIDIPQNDIVEIYTVNDLTVYLEKRLA